MSFQYIYSTLPPSPQKGDTIMNEEVKHLYSAYVTPFSTSVKREFLSNLRNLQIILETE